jgi:DNA-binding SARP family transcriptional activator
MLRHVTVEIRLLGPIEVRTTVGAVTARDFRSKKSRRVLEVLALAGGQTVTKDTLIDTLWRKRLPASPAATVEVAVSLLRSVLDRIDAAGVVLTEPGGYRLDPAAVTIDVLEFDRAVVSAERNTDEERVAALGRALATVRGALLEDEPALDWVAPHRDRARRRVELARLMLGHSALARGDDTLAWEVAEAAWTAADVVLEDAYAIGALALLGQGRRSQAAALLGEAEERLARERSTTPGPALLAVRERLERPFELHGATGVIDLPPALLGLPWPVPFLGRAEVLAEVDAVVRDAARGAGAREPGDVTDAWLHLLGTRGMGKTRTLEHLERHLRISSQGVVVYRLQCGVDDAGVESLLAARLARLVGVRDVVVDAGLFVRLATSFEAIGPAVLLLDDLHLADAESRSVLRALVTAGGASTLAMVSAGGAAPSGARSVRLGLLTVDELAAVGDEEVWRATGGHPLALAACARAALAAGRLDEGGTQDLRSIVGEMGPIAAQVVSLAAHAGGQLTVEDVNLLTGVDPSAVDAAVIDLAAAGVVVRRVDGAFEVESSLFRAIFAR